MKNYDMKAYQKKLKHEMDEGRYQRGGQYAAAAADPAGLHPSSEVDQGIGSQDKIIVRVRILFFEKFQLGILGGTFDPIHTGHLILAQAAYESFSLDFVMLMPNGNPPHKPGQVQASLPSR